MDYGRLVVLGYTSYRVAMSKTTGSNGENASHASRSPQGLINTAAEVALRKSERDRRVVGQMWEPIGDQNAQYKLTKRSSGNGVKLKRFHHFYDPRLRDEGSGEESSPASASSSSSSKSDLKMTTRRMMHAVEIRNKSLAVQEHGPRRQQAASYLLCVPMNDNDAHASITEYVDDDSTDMFQIGRMPCRQNDVVIPGPRVGASGTISRYAARILCSREAPYECRMYAGGFDASRRMTTAGHALKRCGSCGEWLKRVSADHKCVHELMEDCIGNQQDAERQEEARDAKAKKEFDLDHMETEVLDAKELPFDGLTKNGVRVWLPEHKVWFEVSVNGNLYPIAPRTASPHSSSRVRSSTVNPDTSVRHSAFNRPTVGIAVSIPAVLTNGSIIDLGGVQLQFQSQWNNQNSEEDSLLRASISLMGDSRASQSSAASKLERMNVHCPVQLHPLRFLQAANGEDIEVDQVPHVFPACGHVFGYEQRIARSKMCPLCRHTGNFVPLLLKENFQLMSRAECGAIPECVFNPCGHAISSKLAVHYAGLLMPNGRAICPFCAVHLDVSTPFSRLYLYSEAAEAATDLDKFMPTASL